MIKSVTVCLFVLRRVKHMSFSGATDQTLRLTHANHVLYN